MQKAVWHLPEVPLGVWEGRTHLPLLIDPPAKNMAEIIWEPDGSHLDRKPGTPGNGRVVPLQSPVAGDVTEPPGLLVHSRLIHIRQE